MLIESGKSLKTKRTPLIQEKYIELEQASVNSKEIYQSASITMPQYLFSLLCCSTSTHRDWTLLSIIVE